MEIRKEQMDALGEAQEDSFRERLKEMLEEDYPEDCEDLGDTLDAVIHLGLERARAHGIEREKDIGLYFDIMFTLAYNFDTNPDYPWAAKILKQSGLSAKTKLQRVAALAQEALEQEAQNAED